MAAVGVTEVVGAAADRDVPVPSVTMLLRVALPGVAAVWANAGNAAAIQISVAKRTVPIIGATQPASCPARQPPGASTFGVGGIAARPCQPKTKEENALQTAHHSPNDSSSMTMNPDARVMREEVRIRGIASRASGRGRRPRQGCSWSSGPLVGSSQATCATVRRNGGPQL